MDPLLKRLREAPMPEPKSPEQEQAERAAASADLNRRLDADIAAASAAAASKPATAPPVPLKNVPPARIIQAAMIASGRLSADDPCLAGVEPDSPWLARLWIMPNGRPTLRTPTVCPLFEPDVAGAKPTFGDPTDIGEMEQDAERELLLDDLRRETPDYLAPATWCYLRWTGAGQVEALRNVLPWKLIDYPMVVACDLKRQEDEGDRRKRKGSVRRIATDAGDKTVFPWAPVKLMLAGLNLDLRKYPVVLSEHAFNLVVK
jgi:hypothetical protein